MILEMAVVRLLSIAVVFLAKINLSPALFKITFLSLLFGHYFLSFFYAKKQFTNLISEKKLVKPFLILVLITTAYIISGYHVMFLLPFIVFHVAMSEAYMINENLGLQQINHLGDLNLSRFFLNLILMAWLMHDQSIFAHVSLTIFELLVGLSILYFFYAVYKISASIPVNKVRSLLCFEITGVFIAIVLYLSKVQMVQQYFVLYHVATWLFFPTLKFFKMGKVEEAKKLMAMTTLATGAFFLMLYPLVDNRPFLNLDRQIALWASIHFLGTFASSRLNPKIIKNIFFKEINREIVR